MQKHIVHPITAWLVSGVLSTALPIGTVRADRGDIWNTLGGYTTYFNVNDVGRCENIAIAGGLIDGITLQAFGEFSFNQTVGRRTAEWGFRQAKIIVNGEYVLGVGGGVCQVSTTLYNTALLSGLTVTEYHPHSLQVGYVAPSRDAMVSTSSDLKLYNPYPFAVRLSAKVKDGHIQMRFLGKGKAVRYQIVSQKLADISPPEPIVKSGKREEILREARSGVKSEAYLETYQKEKLVARKRLRVDVYRPIQGIVVKKMENTQAESGENSCQTLGISGKR